MSVSEKQGRWVANRAGRVQIRYTLWTLTRAAYEKTQYSRIPTELGKCHSRTHDVDGSEIKAESETADAPVFGFINSF